MKTRSSFLLLLLSCLISGCLAAVRLHHIAAVEIKWVYSKRGGHSLSAETKTFQKIVYKEYHDSGFSREKVGPEWRGLLGPTLRAEVGDTLKIHFKNKAAYSFNIRPQGIPDGKSAEGFIHGSKLYFESNDEHIKPMQEHTYEWKITAEVGPTTFDPQCLTYIYSSDVDIVKDRQSGLIGALLICKSGSLDENGEQNEFQSEFVLLFSVFDESRSRFYEDEKTPMKMYSINGFTNGTLPELNVSVYGKVSWHLIGMSYGPEIFSVHFNGQVLLQNNHRVSSIGLTPGSSITAEMIPTEVGKWLLSSQVQHHRQAELYGFLNIEKGDLEQPSTGFRSTRSSGKIRPYFIAAEEMYWNYASDIPSYIDSDYRSKYLEQRPNRIGKIYKKAKYVEYTDETFTKYKPLEEDKGVSMLQDGIGAPIIRGEVGDIIKIYFKNKASRPYSIYPNGISISKINEGVKYPRNSSDSKSQVEPDQIQKYLWVISEMDGPTSLDPRCLTRVYHSAVDTTRDIASGLLGPLLICKGRSLDARNLQIRVDQEQRIIFAAIDENQSWYIDENIQSCLYPSSVDPTDPEFYESNIMYTINGFVYESKEALPFCEGDITYWHVFSIGSQDRLLSINFHGHTFNYRKMNEDVIHLFPLSGETVSMLMDNSGEWLLRPLSTQLRTYGMRMRIKVLQCDDEMVSHPLVFFKIEYEGDKVLVDVSEEENDQNIDEDTLELLKEFGLRSFKNLQENTEGEDILQFIEGDSTEHNTVAFKEEATSYPNGTQSRTSINASKPINLTNEGIRDDLDYSEEDSIEESVKLNESSTVEPTTAEAPSEVTPLAESGSDSRPLNSTSTNTLLSHNMQSMVEETTSLETLTKDNDTRDGTNGPEDIESMAAIDSTTLLQDRNDTGIPLSLTEQIPESTLRHSNNSQLSAESASYANTTDGEGEEAFASIPQGNSTGRNRQKGNVEDLIGQDDEDVVEVNTDSEMGGQQEVIKGVAVKTGVGAELGLVHDSMSVEDNQAIEEALTPDFIQRGVNQSENITNNGSTSEATTNGEKKISLSQVSSETLQHFTDSSEDSSTETSRDSEEKNIFSQVSSEVPNHFTNTSEESSLESGENREKVFIFLKKYAEDEHRVRFQGTPLKPNVHRLTYQVEGRGVRVSKVKSLKRYIKDSVKNNSRQMLKPVENTRRKAAAEMMLKHRNKMKQLSPRGFKLGMKQHIHVPMGKNQFSPGGFKPKQKYSVIYQDVTSSSIIIGVPKLNHQGTHDYDEYIANVEVNPLGAALENEEKTRSDSVNPYTHDERTHSQLSRDPEMIVEHYLRSHSGNVRRYFIAAEEIYWDYSRNAIRDFARSTQQRNTLYKKVIFQRYTDAFFQTRYTHGEREDHLGILGPVIRAEINDVIKVMFKNLASRPYSIHAHGVSYEKSSEGMRYEDFSTDWFKSDDAVPPNATYTYVWNVPPRSGPEDTDSVCKPWVYYSSVDFEKDINSGLIGPLLICQNGTLSLIDDIPKDAPEFIFLFNTFDETKSWYLNDNKRQSCNADCGEDSDFIQRNTFHAINGFTNGSLRGLVMFEKELVRLYLISMGSSEEAHTISLDGHTFIEKIDNTRHRLGIYSLYPGAFRTVELYSSKPGIWLLQCENGEDYKGGMQAHVLVLSKGCDRPLGLVSGSITDSQITASDHVGKWEPRLARLHNSDMVNAWSVEMNNKNIPWIQVDLERPIVVTELSTQGASSFFVQQYIRAFYITYSVDGKNWKHYNGNSRSNKQIFDGNSDSSDVKFNKFNPPIIARYLKLYPTSFNVRPTLRMELYGCEIDYCSHPLGMKGGNISNDQITASSVQTNWWGSWSPGLARLDMQGSYNAWRSYKDDENQWLQVNFQEKMKISGIITQGAKSFRTMLFVQSYSVHFSNDGHIWIPYTEDSSRDAKIFIANSDHNGHKKNYISPSISAKYIRIVPKTWYNGIALRVEFIGCAFK